VRVVAARERKKETAHTRSSKELEHSGFVVRVAAARERKEQHITDHPQSWSTVTL
jgi:hypothetical protein